MNSLSNFNTQIFASRLSILSFFILFPGFAIYHTLVINHIIPAFLGNLFVQASVISFLAFSPFFPRLIKKTLSHYFYLSFSQITIFTLAIVITLLFSYYDGVTSPAVLQSMQLLFFWSTMLIIGYFFIQAPKKNLLKILLVLSFFYFIYVVYFMVTTGKVMLDFGTTTEFEKGEVSGYQPIARSFLLVSLFCIAFLKKPLVSILFSIGFGVILFTIGARSEFFAFLAAIIAHHIILSFKFKSNAVAIVAILVFTLLTATFFLDKVSQSRQFQVFDLDQSASWIAREEFKERAIRDVLKNPIFGDFGGHVRDGISGENAHNIIAAYSNYGVLFFILFLYINLAITIKSAYALIKSPHSNEWRFCFMLSFAVLLLLFTGKSVFWIVTYLSWGVYFGTVYCLKYNLSQLSVKH